MAYRRKRKSRKRYHKKRKLLFVQRNGRTF